MGLDIASGLLDQVEMVVDETSNLPPGATFPFYEYSSFPPFVVELF